MIKAAIWVYRKYEFGVTETMTNGWRWLKNGLFDPYMDLSSIEWSIQWGGTNATLGTIEHFVWSWSATRKKQQLQTNNFKLITHCTTMLICDLTCSMTFKFCYNSSLSLMSSDIFHIKSNIVSWWVYVVYFSMWSGEGTPSDKDKKGFTLKSRFLRGRGLTITQTYKYAVCAQGK